MLPDGVFASGEQIDRQIAADLAERDRIAQPRRGAEEGNKRFGVKVFKAEGIGHERIDDRLIAAQPVEGRARRLECGVEEVAARGLRKRGPRQAFKRSRSREDQTINLVAVVDDVSLRGKGSHVVPQEEQRQVGIFLSGDLAQADHVLDEKFKAAPAKFSQLRVGREAVPAMIVGVDGETCRNERHRWCRRSAPCVRPSRGRSEQRRGPGRGSPSGRTRCTVRRSWSVGIALSELG